MYAAEPHAALALVAQRGIVDCVPTAKPKKMQNHQTELQEEHLRDNHVIKMAI